MWRTYSLYFHLALLISLILIWNNLLQVLREGNKGYGILVSSAPKESNAIYSLRDPSEVNLIFNWVYIFCLNLFFCSYLFIFYTKKAFSNRHCKMLYRSLGIILCGILLVLFAPNLNLPYHCIHRSWNFSSPLCCGNQAP